MRGSWGPVLSAHLLGPLKMTGKQAGWIYAMYPLGCIVAPLIGGQIVDRWIATEWFWRAHHLASGFLLLLAAHAVRFRSMLAAHRPALPVLHAHAEPGQLAGLHAHGGSAGGVLPGSRVVERGLGDGGLAAVGVAHVGQAAVPRHRRPVAGRGLLVRDGRLLPAVPAAHAACGRVALGRLVGASVRHALQRQGRPLLRALLDPQHAVAVLLPGHGASSSRTSAARARRSRRP